MAYTGKMKERNYGTKIRREWTGKNKKNKRIEEVKGRQYRLG